jgi:hypothetical protein
VRSRVTLAVLGVMIAAAVFPARVEAVTCGTTDADAGAASAKGVLTLDENSTTTIAFKRKTGARSLLLIFRVAGCELESAQPEPEIDVLPKKDIEDVPEGVMNVRRIRREPLELAIRLTVDPKKFNPGSYGGLIELTAPYLRTSRTPVAVSRSEDTEAIPIMIGAGSGLIAFIWFLLLKLFARNKLQIGWRPLSFVLIAAAIVGALAAFLAYRDQDVWTFGDNFDAAIIAGITGATTGTMGVVLGLIATADKAAD